MSAVDLNHQRQIHAADEGNFFKGIRDPVDPFKGGVQRSALRQVAVVEADQGVVDVEEDQSLYVVGVPLLAESRLRLTCGTETGSWLSVHS